MLLIKIVENCLVTLYQYFGFSILLSVFVMFFYLYAYQSIDAGHGWKAAFRSWLQEFRTSVVFRRLFFLTFYTAIILFRTLLNRSMWANPMSDIMGGWWIWKTNGNGERTLTTEAFENLALMIPFIVLMLWAMEAKIKQALSLKMCMLQGVKTAFLFSVCIEFLQLFLRLGTFQLSDLFYNTIGGLVGGFGYGLLRNNKPS